MGKVKVLHENIHFAPPPFQVRRLSIQGRRVLNYMSKLSNNIKFTFYGVEHGKNLCVHGHVGLRMARGSRVIIGGSFYYSSGQHINPLSCNKQGNITVNEGAKVLIGDHVGMSGTVIWCHQNITIGNNVQIGAEAVLLDSDCHSLNFRERRCLQNDMLHKKNAPIVIGHDVLIGMNSIILKGVTIGDRSIIGAGSVVTTNIPADCIAAGNPCKVIKRL